MGEPRSVGLAAAVAVAGGYVLGRSQKGHIALAAAALLVSRGLSSRNAVSGEAEAAGREGQRQNTLAAKAGSVASAAANRSLTALTDALHARTHALYGEPGRDEDTVEGADDAFEEEPGTDAPGADGGRAKRVTQKAPTAPRKRAVARKRPATRPSPAKKPAVSRSGPAKKPAARPRRER